MSYSFTREDVCMLGVSSATQDLSMVIQCLMDPLVRRMEDDISDSVHIQECPFKKRNESKDKKHQKGKKNSFGVTKCDIDKIKKSGFSNDMTERNEKKKRRYKRRIMEMDEGCFFTQGISTSSPIQRWINGHTPSINSTLPCKPFPLTQLSVSQISDPKTKRRKKKKIFDLPPGNVCKTCSKKALCVGYLPKDSSQLFGKDSEMGPCQAQEDSQSTVDNLNSQDLFITQKKCKALLSNSSSNEPVKAIPSTLTLRETVESHTHQQFEALSVTNANMQLEQTPRAPHYLKHKSFPRQLPRNKPLPQLILRSKVEEATQTENFFTPRLCSYLMFKEQISLAASSELPLNLSLPCRTRAELDQKPHYYVVDNKYELVPTECLLPSSINLKPIHIESDGGLSSSVIQTKDGDCIPLQLFKSADTTSSEDNQLILHSAKTDLSQVGTVQTRLNESYFFKMKGNEQVARPQSPLMKLTRKKNTRKRD